MTAVHDRPVRPAPTGVPLPRTRHRPGRTQHLHPSAIRALASGAAPDVIDLGLGEPRWALPDAARGALARFDEPTCGYGPAEGLPELREAVGRHHGVRAEDVMIGAGAQGVLFALLHTAAGLGDLVAVPDPGFPGYRTLTQVAGATPVGYPLADDGSLDPAAVVAVLDRYRPAVLVLNHPGNPTGGRAEEGALRAVLAAAARRDCLVISDEVYRDLHLHPSPGAVEVAADLPQAGPGVVAVSSVSKAWAAPGLRVGWAIGHPDVLGPARLLHQTMTTSASRPAQLAATALVDASAEVLPTSRAELRARWDVVAASPFAHHATEAGGGFYLWLPTPESTQDTEAHARALRDEHGVLVVPGTAFGGRGAGRVRVGLGGDVGELALGLDRLADAWATR